MLMINLQHQRHICRFALDLSHCEGATLLLEVIQMMSDFRIVIHGTVSPCSGCNDVSVKASLILPVNKVSSQIMPLTAEIGDCLGLRT